MRRFSVILIWVVCATGCREDPEASAFVVRDSAGVRTIERVPSAGTAERIELVEVPFSEPLPEFGDILDVAHASDGRVLVLDPLGPHVVVLDSTGAESARFGGDGSGPGELRASGLTDLVVLGDAVAVPDIMGQRVTLFSLDGRVMRTLSVPVSDGLAMDWRREGDDRLVFRRVSAPQRLEALSPGSAEFEVLADLGSLSLPPRPGPLTALPVWCRLPDDLLVLGRTDRYALGVHRAGALTAAITGGAEARPVSEDDWEHLESLLARSLARRLGGELPLERVRQLLEQTPPPEVAPRIAGVMCSPEGEVWVQRALPIQEMGEDVLRVGSTQGWGASAWDVYEWAPESVRSVALPPGTQLTRITPRLLIGYRTDEYGQKVPARWRRE